MQKTIMEAISNVWVLIVGAIFIGTALGMYSRVTDVDGIGYHWHASVVGAVFGYFIYTYRVKRNFRITSDMESSILFSIFTTIVVIPVGFSLFFIPLVESGKLEFNAEYIPFIEAGVVIVGLVCVGFSGKKIKKKRIRKYAVLSIKNKQEKDLKPSHSTTLEVTTNKSNIL